MTFVVMLALLCAMEVNGLTAMMTPEPELELEPSPDSRTGSSSGSSSSGTQLTPIKCDSIWMSAAGKTKVNGKWKISMKPTWFARGVAWTEKIRRKIHNDLEKCVPVPELTPEQHQSVYEQLACHAKWGKLPRCGGPRPGTWSPVVLPSDWMLLSVT